MIARACYRLGVATRRLCVPYTTTVVPLSLSSLLRTYRPFSSYTNHIRDEENDMTSTNGSGLLWDVFSDADKDACKDFAGNYLKYLSICRMERDRVKWASALLDGRGFKRIETGDNQPLSPGDNVYYVNRNKNIAMFSIGSTPVVEPSGIHLLCAHGDRPRLDLKGRPLYEDDKAGMTMLKTHYYGGVKLYQYGTIPLALVGVVITKDGKTVEVEIGTKPEDPVFTIPDLLPHLSKKVQNTRQATEVLKGEEMNAVLSGLPCPQDGDKPKKDRFKSAALAALNAQYGIIEEDLSSAELSLVPAIPARYVGIDKSFIGGSHDDGICCYLGTTALLASLDAAQGKPLPQTAGVVFYDKEEIGSNGATGAKSAWLQHVLADVVARCSGSDSIRTMHKAFSNMDILSADVAIGLNPNFPSVHDPLNCATLGRGTVIEKYTGHGGKYGASDADPTTVWMCRKLIERAGVLGQYGGMGKIDEGGGGTIAHVVAEQFNCNVIDIGPAVVNMHSPFELVHIADVYATHKVYMSFLKDTPLIKGINIV